MYTTRRNIEILCRSATWYLDGTFKVSPTIFTQLFTVLGLRKRNRIRRDSDPGIEVEEEGVPVPLLYAFLSGKQTNQYSTVLQAVKDAVDQYRIAECVPTRIMCDFEKAIINACEVVFPDIQIKWVGELNLRQSGSGLSFKNEYPELSPPSTTF